MFLIRYIRIDVGVVVNTGIGAGSPEDATEESEPELAIGEGEIKEFQFRDQRRKIFYIMRNDTKNPDGSMKSFLKSENFIAIIDMEYLTIPRNGLEFFLLLLEDVEAKWMQLVASARLHLAKIVSSPFQSTIN